MSRGGEWGRRFGASSEPPTSGRPPTTPARSSLRPTSNQRGTPSDRPESLAEFARQMGVERRRSTAKMRAIHAADFGLFGPTQRLMDDVLGVHPGDRVAVVHDAANEPLVRAFELDLSDRKAFCNRVEMSERPSLIIPEAVRIALTHATVTVVALDRRDEEDELHRALVALAAEHGSRHLHLVGVSREAFVSCLGSAPSRVFALQEKARALLSTARVVSVRSSAGTDLTIRVAGPASDPTPRPGASGRVRPGQHVTVPFGSVLAVAEEVDGMFVVDASMSEHLVDGRAEVTRPLQLHLRQGRVESVRGEDASAVRALERRLSRDASLDRVGMFRLGVNVGLTAALGEVDHDQQLPGVHLVLGRKPAALSLANLPSKNHATFAMSGADVDVDGDPLVRGGRFVRWV